MKTALQELINQIEASQNRYIDLAKADKRHKKGVDAILTATTLIKIKAFALLEKEKQQIISAYETDLASHTEFRNGSAYYEAQYTLQL